MFRHPTWLHHQNLKINVKVKHPTGECTPNEHGTPK